MLNLPHIATLATRPLLPENCSVYLVDISQIIVPELHAQILLSQAELDRAEKFRSPLHRQQHLQCHAVLRLLLAERIDLDADQITFDKGEFGKPALSGQAADSRVAFNIAHSGSYAVIAIGTELVIGVDIEKEKTGRRILEIADHCFAEAEQESIRARPPSTQTDAFFSCWCRKESFIKAIGLGLHMPLDRFVVNVDPAAAAELLSVDYPGQQISDWQMYTLLTPDGYFGALTLGYVNSADSTQG